MGIFILTSGILIVICLIAEKFSAVRHRHALKHVIHVNGTRGKSAVTRLIAAGLAESGMKTFCKTTGTLPMTIDVSGNEELIVRRGRANISEQISILAKAAKNGAEALVVECMAVDPELQYVCENQILNADIGVITNARVDHLAEQGDNERDVCEALCNTVPKNGMVFTCEENCFELIRRSSEKRGTEAILVKTEEAALPADFETAFPENAALALAVCMAAGVDRDTALRGMKKVKEDPFAASRFRLKNGAVFINGMSANDPESTRTVFERFSGDLKWNKKVIILNCRSDRGYRTNLMAGYIAGAGADEVLLIGKGTHAAERKLKKLGCKNLLICESAGDAELNRYQENTVIYAIGNIAGPGMELMEYIKCSGVEEKIKAGAGKETE